MRCYLILGLWPVGLCASVSALLKAFSLPLFTIFLSLWLIPPNLPFTHILLSTSLSHCAMVAQSLLFPAAMKPQTLFHSGVHLCIQLHSQNSVFYCSSPKRSFLQSQMSWKYLSWRRSVPFSIVSVPTEKLFTTQVKIHFKLSGLARFLCLVLTAK